MSLHARKMNHSRDVATQASAQQEAVGYMIDEQGREIPITEQMIKRACATLHENWIPPIPSGRAGVHR